jgi:galactose mutarotase-like enzyme
MASHVWHLENCRFRVTVQAQGGELCSLWDKGMDREWLWQPQEGVWNNSATQLFPVIGRLIHGGIWQGEQFCPLPAHGFLREQVFCCVEQSASRLTLEATASNATFAVWPWRWRVTLSFELTDDGLLFSQKVNNDDTTPFWYSVGWHPGFALPLSSEQGWQVRFAGDGVKGPMPTCQRTLTVAENLQKKDVFLLQADSFTDGAVYFADCQEQLIQVCTPDGKTVLSMETTVQEWLALWGVPGADLLCIEPLAGTTDAPDFDGQAGNKRGMRQLAPGESQVLSVRLRFPVDVRSTGSQNTGQCCYPGAEAS